MSGLSSTMSEETKQFLQEGLRSYAPSLVAISDFRRQVQTRLRDVLNKFSPDFARIGLRVSDLGLVDAKLDGSSLDENSQSVELQKNHGGGFYTAYNLAWDLRKAADKRVWVEASIFVGRQADRDRLYAALQKHCSPGSTAVLSQYRAAGAAGGTRLRSYIDPDLFYGFDEAFRTLVKEWVGLLSNDNVRPFIPTAAGLDQR